jgi:hypothetical protein
MPYQTFDVLSAPKIWQSDKLLSQLSAFEQI